MLFVYLVNSFTNKNNFPLTFSNVFSNLLTILIEKRHWEWSQRENHLINHLKLIGDCVPIRKQIAKMAFQWQDNLHSTTFTPRDYQVELLAAACEQNLVICLGHNSSKEFIALKLILEHSNELRRLENRKRTLFITRDSHGGDSAFNLLFHLTDLSVINLNSTTKAKIDFEKCFDKYQVIILSTELCIDALICSFLDLKMINMIVIEDCHKNSAADELQQLFEFMKDCKYTPKILGLAGAIHNAACSTNQLDFQLQRLEKAIHCRAETASDIVTVLR